VFSLPVFHIREGLPDDGSKPKSTTERRAYDDLAKGFGPGFNGPLTVVVDAKGAKDAKAAVTAITRQIGATGGVVSVSAARFNATGDTAIFSAIPSTAPDDQKTTDLIHTLRAERPALETATGATFAVTGSTAVNIDSAQKVQESLIPYLGVVVGLAFLLLLIVFRSVL